MTTDNPDPTIKFAADRMLGRLAKWLRVIGQDVIYGDHLSGYGLIGAARRDDRLILTRDRTLKHKQPPAFMLIASDHYLDQLRQVIEECQLTVGVAVFSRCLRCNALLQAKAKNQVETAVPAYVLATQEQFSWCPGCQRIYWPATHQRKMVDRLKELRLC